MKIYRKNEIISFCINKRVLHLGFVQHANLRRDKINNDDWLHDKVLKVAKSTVGIDYLKSEVDIIKDELSIECYYGDVTDLNNMNYQSKFDVVICGELIEHLSNPGLMLDGIKRFMNEDTVLIITTPNPWRDLWVSNMYNGITEEKWLNKEHVCWYSFQTLKQLLERHDYSEVKYSYYYSEQAIASPTKKINYLKKLIKNVIKFYNEDKSIPEKYEGLFFVAKVK